MEPEVGRSMVEMQLSRVVFPEPEAPMIPTYSPASRDRSTPSRARVTAPRFPYTFVKSFTHSSSAMWDSSFRRAWPARIKLYDIIAYSFKKYPKGSLRNFLSYPKDVRQPPRF